MAPTPQEYSSSAAETGAPVRPAIPPPLQQDDVVISGLSGLYPTCHNVNEFSEKLYNHENFVKSENVRWEYEDPEVTKYIGVVPDLEKFDAQYFMIHHHLAHMTDIMTRKLLEQTYQAIIDSGTSPIALSGKNIGVFIGANLSVTDMLSTEHTGFSQGSGAILGSNRAMFANRISYWLNAKGPSLSIDACGTSGMVCLEKAYEAIRRGDCEAAIAGGCSTHLFPHACVHYDRMLGVNPDGKTKSFDKNADGISPSECISVVFLQKAKDAKRIYATICGVETQYSKLNGDFMNRLGPVRDPSILSSFYYQFYKASNILPRDVEYIEAFGSGLPEADKKELQAIQDVFCADRDDPLLVGSVMSNMGYSNAASAQAALTKVCLAYQTGKIAANLHYETPPEDVPALSDGRMRVVTDNMPFRRSYTAINSLSLTGMNGHLLLKGDFKPKDKTRYASKIPYLITVSARKESGVGYILNDFKSNPIDPEVIALFHNVQKTRDSKHLARGYAIFKNDESGKTICVNEKENYHDDAKKPLWFVYSGMGSQWNGMGRELMSIPIFADAISRCQKVMKPKGIDILHIITTDDKTIFDNIIHCFVGITAVQIGLTNVLLSMGLKPDNLIGHSLGEMGCAYADGCVTAEEMILSSYYRGLASVETPLIKGTMAAVGLGAQKMALICPPEITIACHNSSESCTISGPYEKMAEFISKLTDQGIFAKAVNSANKAYHSRYIADAAPAFLKYLKSFMKPKPRSKKWLSTSVPKEKWNTPAAQMNSAEYHTNNLLSPVLFEETAQAIPANAVVIEVAPHGLLQAILKRSLSTCTNVPLTRRGHPDGVTFFLNAIGGLYLEGFNPDLSVLYPKVEFPVSTETRSLSHLVEWVHEENWNVSCFTNANRSHAATFDTTFSMNDDEYSFLRGHIVDGKNIFPAAGALVFVWDALSMSVDVQRKSNSVQFKDVHFHVEPQIFDDHLLNFGVTINRGTGYFEVISEEIVIATGYVQALNDVTKGYYTTNISDEMVYSSDDIYTLFYEKGYGYSGEFRSIQNANADMNEALIAFNNNWVTFIDAVMQMNILRKESDGIVRPRYIQQLNIDLKQHHLTLQSIETKSKLLEANHLENLNATRCGGVIIRNLLSKHSHSYELDTIGLKTLQFVPHHQKDIVDISTALSTFLQIISENVDRKLNALDVTKQIHGSCLYNKVKELLPELSASNVTIDIKIKENVSEYMTETQVLDFVFLDKLLVDSSLYQSIVDAIPTGTFVVVLEEGAVSQSIYKVVASAITHNGRLVLGRWRSQNIIGPSKDISVTSTEDLPKLKLARDSLTANGSLNILTYYPAINELKDLVKKWRKDFDKNEVYITMIPKTSFKDLQTGQVPQNVDLPYTVLKDGIAGGYYFIGCKQDERKELPSVTLTNRQIGNLDSLHWREVAKPKSGNSVVSVHYAGLNSFDAKKAIGDLSGGIDEVSGQQYGLDFSGLTASGERVMGIVRCGAASSEVSAEPSLLWPVPEHWTLEDAATVPLPYAHALYCLVLKCKLYEGMSVLVHGASGALGQAIISIALANKCTVFAAVSNMKKKQLLRNVFPNLPGKNIGSSRHESFGDMVLTETKGNGCDIVISCAKGGLKNTLLTCCASWGTTIDTQNVHSSEEFTYGMYNMTRCRSYIASDFSSIFESENHEERKQLQVMVSEGIARGFVRPLSRVTYGALESARALRLLATSRHFGRALLRIYNEAVPSIRKLTFSNSCSHLIISTTADNVVALRVVHFLIQRGASSIVLHQQNGSLSDAYLRFKMMQWEKPGAKVKITFGDIYGKEKCTELIRAQNKLSPIDSIHTIVDSASNKETCSFLCNLDEITRKSNPDLRLFVVISNDADIGTDICTKRTTDGLPSLMFKLPNIQKFNKSSDNVLDKESLQLRNVIPILEDAICLSGPVAVVYKKQFERTFIQKVSEIANFNCQVDENIKLKELGIDSENLPQLLQLLRKQEIDIPQECIPELTLAKLKELQDNVEQAKSKVVTGLGVLFSGVHTDELLQQIIYLQTPIQQASLRGDSFDPDAEYLIMIPGMDEQYNKFETICKRLKLHAAVMLPGLENINESVSETAQRLVKVILKRFCTNKKFYLMGYSFGVLIALEIAAILEKHDMTGVVYCVDASPVTFPAFIDSRLHEESVTDMESLQNATVQHMCKLMIGSTSDHLTTLLQGATSWDDKVLAGVSFLQNKVPQSMQYIRTVIEAAYARIAEARQYDSSQFRPLCSQIVLLRSQSNTHTSYDLGLARFSELKPQVYEVTADHATALNDVRCASIINRHLDQKILDHFNTTNLCKTVMCTNSIYFL